MHVNVWASSRWAFWLFTFGLTFSVVSTSSLKVSLADGDDSDYSRREAGARDTWTDQVQFDQYSLLLKGHRVFLHSGEFMTYRLPIPSLWPDILEKFKAAGLNGLSLYTHMGAINPSKGVVDFDGYRALQPLFEAAKEIGIWIVLRPGPYINAETSAGGLSHWITAEVAGKLRSNDSDYREAWTPYIKGIIDQARPYQITEGGPIIAMQVDNEYGQSAGGPYFEDLKAVYRNKSSGIVLPLTYNDPGMGRSFINGTGAVDLYGFDAYPNRYDCSHPDVWRPVPENYHDYHQDVNPSQPLYIPEYQGGSLQAWGPGTPDYSGCYALTGATFESVFHRQLWADNVKLLNYYPLYGGTSWGNIPFHGVYTSYDWGAAISEPRTIGTKYTELKLQGLFLRSSPEFYKTNVVANSTQQTFEGSITSINNTSPAFVTLLRNPDTGAGFWIARQKDSTSTALAQFKLTVTSSSLISNAQEIRLPQIIHAISLAGRESKVIVTDYLFGVSSRALYSTASVLFAGSIDGKDVLFLFGDAEQEHEAAFRFSSASVVTKVVTPLIKIHDDVFVPGISVVTFSKGINGVHTVHSSDSQLIVYADSNTAGTFWAPSLSAFGLNDRNPHKNFWSIGTNQSVLVGGPYLVRSAQIHNGLHDSALNLRGDLNVTERGQGATFTNKLTIIAPRNITSITWNGKEALLDSLSSETGYRTATIQTDNNSPKTDLNAWASRVPDLSGATWRFADSLPEVKEDWNDSGWVEANHTTTNVPFPMNYGDGRILYGCDYGYCEGVVIWRGHFNETGQQKNMNLSINGGQGFAASVWLNDVFLNTSFGNSSNGANNVNETDQTFLLPEYALKKGEDNVVTVVQDNMGLNENWYTDNQMKSPRGIRGFQLKDGNFTTWKVQGKVGTYNKFPDKHRGVMNEGGLFGERKGWHLPQFDTSGWQTRNLSVGLPGSQAGVGFFVTTFDINVAFGYDVPMFFNFEDLDFQHQPVQEWKPYRALLFVNGWMMGKVVANLGPQAKFPVHEGILNYGGTNTVAVALWAMTPNVTIAPRLRLKIDGIYESGIGKISAINPGWSANGRE
ncbi:glycoside hydrolase family 35 protein [Crepidotus variabilis]|uniref:beta-galactosidase n=1 Tax=Crepidotus variabilis TaxID=179855 RepID=A0A9P6E467_9AGAR|nr:glycoside hydrolase family 35 protein [Crepidotus variabilis]